jgi:hypothetical protein
LYAYKEFSLVHLITVKTNQPEARQLHAEERCSHVV